MSPGDTRTLRPQVRVRAQGRCEYCQLPEEADFARYERDAGGGACEVHRR
jgi:hypothetical protein